MQIKKKIVAVLMVVGLGAGVSGTVSAKWQDCYESLQFCLKLPGSDAAYCMRRFAECSGEPVVDE